MEYEEFKEKVIKELEDYYGGDAEVKLQENVKNNGIVREGVTVSFHGAEQKAAPVAYLDGLYEQYRERGCDFTGCVAAIVDGCRQFIDSPDGELSEAIEIIKKWDRVKERVYPVLINTERNARLLEALISKKMLDLSVIYLIRVCESKSHVGNVKVSRELFGLYGIRLQELHDTAMKNQKGDGYQLEDMDTVLGRLCKNCCMEEESERNRIPLLGPGRMFVLTNRRNLYGAAGVLDVDFLRRESMGRSFYIIPSSIHETFLIPADEVTDSGRLDKMIREVNPTINPEEVLADHSYYYDAVRNEICMKKYA